MAHERILIAGCGDVGLRAAGLLAARGAQLWGLRRRVPEPGAAPAGMRWIAADLRDPATLGALPEGITRLAYLPTPQARSVAAYTEIFLHGLRNLLRALDASALRRTVLVSSTAVYGEHHGDWVDEATAPAPAGANGHVLLQAEQWLARQPGSHVVLRLAGLYGPGRGWLLERLRRGQAAAPRHRPHWANRIHVQDAAGALAHLLLHPCPQPCYIGCDDTPLPLHELYGALAALVGGPEPPDGPAPAGVGSKRLSNARLRASGYVLRWPDSRAGYAALLARPDAA
ncbi:NAD-dependent epimerase/dehydratase family protein [Orrella sp. JC864]